MALDAGHGGFDTGAEAIIKELEVCEQTVNALYTLLEQDSNYAPVRTRPNGEDRSIKERAQAATDAGASLLLSVHANSDESTGQSHGFECFPTPPGRTYSEESMRFAQCIAQKMGGAGHRLRGENGIRFAYYNGKSKRIVDSTDTKIREQKSFGIVERPYCPAVLVEQCFLTNYSDVENWTGEPDAPAPHVSITRRSAPISAPSLCRRAAACERRTALSTNTAARPRPLRRGRAFCIRRQPPFFKRRCGTFISYRFCGTAQRRMPSCPSAQTPCTAYLPRCRTAAPPRL